MIACAEDTPTEAANQSAAGPPQASLAGFTPGAGGLSMHDGNTIHACAKQQGGDLRLVSDPEDCLPSEVAVSWSIQGPQGPSGVVAAHMHTASETNSEDTIFVQAICEASEIATGGGFDMFGPALSFAQVRDSRPGTPLGGDLPTSWRVFVNKPGADGLELQLNVYVICVPVGGK
jgi:hypothetical protein